MKEQAITKINKMGKIGSIILLIARIFCIIGLVFTVIATIAIACIPKNFVILGGNACGKVVVDFAEIGEELDQDEVTQIESILDNGGLSVDTGSVNLNLDRYTVDGNVLTLSGDGDVTDSVSVHDFFYVTLSASITIALTLVTLFFGGFLCKAFKECESPFSEEVIKSMRRFAYSLIPWVLISNLTDSLMASFFNGGVSFSFSLNIGMAFVVLVIFALVYVFKYGAMLQQESDETL